MKDTYYTRQFKCGHCKQVVKIAMKYKDKDFVCPNCLKECHVKSMEERENQLTIDENEPKFLIRYCDKCGEKLIVTDTNADRCICPKCDYNMPVKKMCRQIIKCEHCNTQINCLVDYNDSSTICPTCKKVTHFKSRNELIESNMIVESTYDSKKRGAVKTGIIAFCIGTAVQFLMYDKYPVSILLICLIAYVLGVFVDSADDSNNTVERQHIGFALVLLLPVIALPYYAFTTRNKFSSFMYWFTLGVLITDIVF